MLSICVWLLLGTKFFLSINCQLSTNYQYPAQNIQHRNDPLDSNNDLKNVEMMQPHYVYNNNSSRRMNFISPVRLGIQLIEYINEDLRLPGGKTCVCPSGFECPYLGTSIARCYISLTIIISSPNSSVQYLSTGFLPLNSSGYIEQSAKQQNIWHKLQIFEFTTKPSAIDIFAHHLGVVIDQYTGDLKKMHSVVHVDTFVESLTHVIPLTRNHPKPMNYGAGATLRGTVSGTKLLLIYTLECIGDLVGPNCDLLCSTSVENSGTALCRSNWTGFFYTCTIISYQYLDCLPCPWGITEDHFCRGEDGKTFTPSSSQQLVPSTYKAATVYLGIISSILLILLIFVTMCSCFLANKNTKSRNQSSQSDNGYVLQKMDERLVLAPRLNPSPMNQPASTPRVPIVPPRNTSLHLTALKPSIRKTNYIPLPHLGGDSSTNDTTSIASSLQLPSREADV